MDNKHALVKICGVRTVDAAVAAKEAGAEIIGMIFAPSPRLIDIPTAQGIARSISSGSEQPKIELPRQHSSSAENMSAVEYFKACAGSIHSAQHKLGRPLLTGVFQNQPLEHILEAVHQVPLDLVQLHGTEPVELAKEIPVPVIKVFHVDESMAASNWSPLEDEELKSGLLKPFHHALILLDTKVPGTSQQGGRGVSFDWNIARALADAGVPFVMAGGLTPDNVAQAVDIGKPWAVDVSSGTETEKVKDPKKIHAFVANAKKA
ncbi:anthranilate synthase / indole-3-glycerol phosphate synthase [Dipsacomyces acuminosporus]|nr:anthranilate synthase / indole-3-glycerol phosphate synthase [Dipsacomyces acuminosporus]